MIEEIIYELFAMFLLDNNIYSQFCTNLWEQKHLALDEYIDMWSPERYKYLIFSAFKYSETAEGWIFWWSKNIQWQDYLREQWYGE